MTYSPENIAAAHELGKLFLEVMTDKELADACRARGMRVYARERVQIATYTIVRPIGEYREHHERVIADALGYNAWKRGAVLWRDYDDDRGLHCLEGAVGLVMPKDGS